MLWVKPFHLPALEVPTQTIHNSFLKESYKPQLFLGTHGLNHQQVQVELEDGPAHPIALLKESLPNILNFSPLPRINKTGVTPQCT